MVWGTSKQHMKLQQPRNYDFWASQFDPPRCQSGNDRETTTKVATTVKRRLLHLAIIEAQMITLTATAKLQQLRVNSREMTTFAASCNDREMQRPRSDKLETAQLLQILHKILCRFMAVVVSSAFWKSLIGLSIPQLRFSVAIPAAIYRSAHGPGPESAPQSAFWVLLGNCLGVPQRVLFECFLALVGQKKSKKALKKHSFGHSEAIAQKHSKSTPWGTFPPGALDTPVDGGRDRKFSA